MNKKIILWTMNDYPALHQLSLTIIRITFGIIFFIFGAKKLLSSSDHITQIGSAMSLFGITYGYIIWGYLAALTELCGGLAFIVGFCTRIASLPLMWLLIVALRFHIKKNDPFNVWAFALLCLAVVVAFCITGSGFYSIDHFTNSINKEPEHRP